MGDPYRTAGARSPDDDELPAGSAAFASDGGEDEVFVSDAEVPSPALDTAFEASWKLVALAAAGAIGACVVAALMAIGLAGDGDRPFAPDAAAGAEREADAEVEPWSYLVGAVVATEPTASGRLHLDDRCEVDVRRRGAATCDLFVVCPGAEKRFHDAPCRLDDEGALAIDADGARLDGRAGTVQIEGATIRLDDGPRAPR